MSEPKIGSDAWCDAVVRSTQEKGAIYIYFRRIARAAAKAALEEGMWAAHSDAGCEGTISEYEHGRLDAFEAVRALIADIDREGGDA